MLPFLLAALLAQQRVDSDAGCVKCHESQADDWKGSVHEKHGAGCVKCHGADSVDNRSKPHLYQAGFLRGTKRSNPRLCAACHKPEAEAFDAGAHGEDTRDESGKVKGCSSCHEFHATAVAERQAILKEHCATCHKAGSSQIRWGEETAAATARLQGEPLKAARIAQHALPKGPVPAAPAYNTQDPGPPWAFPVTALVATGAALAWILRDPGRKAS